MTGPGDLVAEDGAVTVPAALVAEVRRALIRDSTEQLRRNGGGRTPLEVSALLSAFDVGVARAAGVSSVAGRRVRPDIGSGGREVASLGVSTSQAAERMGCDPSWVRRLARTGRLRGYRSGGVWVVDQTDLVAYLRERHDHHDRPAEDRAAG